MDEGPQQDTLRAPWTRAGYFGGTFLIAGSHGNVQLAVVSDTETQKLPSLVLVSLSVMTALVGESPGCQDSWCSTSPVKTTLLIR